MFSEIPRYCGTVSHQVNTPTLDADPDSQNPLEWFFKTSYHTCLHAVGAFFGRLSLNLIEPFINRSISLGMGIFSLEKRMSFKNLFRIFKAQKGWLGRKSLCFVEEKILPLGGNRTNVVSPSSCVQITWFCE